MYLLLSVSWSNPQSFLLARTDHLLHARPCVKFWGSEAKKRTWPQGDNGPSSPLQEAHFHSRWWSNKKRIRSRSPLGPKCCSERPETTTHLLLCLTLPPGTQCEWVGVQGWKSVVPKRSYTSGSPGRLVKTDCWASLLDISVRRCGVGPRVCGSIKFRGDANVPNVGPTLEEPLLEGTLMNWASQSGMRLWHW